MRILYFDKLDCISIIPALIFRLTMAKVYYRDPGVCFRNRLTARILMAVGVKWKGYKGLEGALYLEGLKIQFDLERMLLPKLTQSKLYQAIVRYYDLNATGIRKFDAALFSNMPKPFASGATSIPLLRQQIGNGSSKLCFVPAQYSDLVMLRELRDPQISVIGLHAVVRALLTFGIRCCRRLLLLPIGALRHRLSGIFRRRRRSGPTLDGGVRDLADEYALAYFPHQGLKYGDFYKKTYIYHSNNSPGLHNENIITLSQGDPDKVSARYYRRFKLDYLNIHSRYNRDRHLTHLKKLITFLHRDQHFSWSSIISEPGAFFVIKSLVSSVERFSVMLENMPRIRNMYIYYDALFPQALVFSAYLQGIRTIASQERPVQFTHLPNLIYDDYLVCGSGFIPLMKEYNYTAERFHVVGLPRSDFIREPKLPSRYTAIAELKRDYNIVLAFGLFPLDDISVGLYGEDGTSLESNVNFSAIMLQLADELPDAYFIIRYKETDWIDQHMPSELRERIDAAPNVEIMMDLKKYSSYLLLHYADLVIGKQTCIMQEAMAVGKPVIYFDDDQYIKSFSFLTEMQNVASDFTHLKRRVLEYLDTNPTRTDEGQRYIQKYFAREQNGTCHDSVQATLERIVSESCAPLS